VEIPVGNRFEFQSKSSYSPTRLLLADSGNELNVTGSAIFWATQRFGLTASYSRDWLWTSKFDKQAWSVLPGAVFRDNFGYPGRTYVHYRLPTGCVAASPSNLCRNQSAPQEGIEATQEFQITSLLRYGVSVETLHYFEQCNPNEPSVPRHSLFAAAVQLSLTFVWPRTKSDSEY
jgi:hypothetical protein